MNRGNQRSCILRFDGASRGNPGPAGAGAALFTENGVLLYRFREGLGYQTNNAAEYRALILGLNQAFYKGYKNINVQGDSLLVVNQFLGHWIINNPNLCRLCDEASELASNFRSVSVQHISRESNTEADAQANRAINLREGQVEEEPVYY
ncbi:Polynucleotidyl transferase, ribonuclease H superfamily protein [Trifolium repens]|nr:Polynucleotidyl transferase, ribonuclease H superfamily protein [Trifolium repens]